MDKTLGVVLKAGICLLALGLLMPWTASAATGGGGAALGSAANDAFELGHGSSRLRNEPGRHSSGPGVLIFAGGMVNEFLRAVLFCVLVIAFIIAAKNTMPAFGWGAGAEITTQGNIGIVYGFAPDHDSSNRH